MRLLLNFTHRLTPRQVETRAAPTGVSAIGVDRSGKTDFIGRRLFLGVTIMLKHELEDELHHLAHRASKSGLDLETIVGVLESNAYFARYIFDHGATVYPWIKPEPKAAERVLYRVSGTTRRGPSRKAYSQQRNVAH
jgi:hypothetical protein